MKHCPLISFLLVSLAVSSLCPPVSLAGDAGPPSQRVLPAANATLHGNGARIERGMVCHWHDVKATVSWRFPVKVGQAENVILQAAEAASAGHTYEVDLAGKTLPGTVQDTGGWYAFREISLGSVEFPSAGEYELTVRPTKKGSSGVMNLAGVLFLGSAVAGLASLPGDFEHPEWPTLGRHFAKQKYEPTPLPKFETTREKLPSPVFEENADWVAMYWKAWELAFRNFHEPAPGSGFVSQFIDAAFNNNIFLWDTCFLTMFCNYAHPLVPGIGSLDNFYCRQYPDGEIGREIDRASGWTIDPWRNLERQPLFSREGWGGDLPRLVVYRDRPASAQPPFLTLDALNHPIFSWAEREHLRVAGDRQRVGLVYEPLVRYYHSLQEYLRQGNGLFMTDWASMDNSPRNPYLAKGGCGVDTSSQMVLFAQDLAVFAELLGKQAEAAQFQRDAEETAARVNRLMWDADKQFYYDLTWEGERAPVKTIAGFWPLLAGIPSKAQAEALAAELQNTNTFARAHRVPTLAADQRGYDPRGGYWCGAVWAPTDTMVLRGLERYGHDRLARDIALNHLTCIGEVFQRTGTVWENVGRSG